MSCVSICSIPPRIFNVIPALWYHRSGCPRENGVNTRERFEYTFVGIGIPNLSRGYVDTLHAFALCFHRAFKQDTQAFNRIPCSGVMPEENPFSKTGLPISTSSKTERNGCRFEYNKTASMISVPMPSPCPRICCFMFLFYQVRWK